MTAKKRQLEGQTSLWLSSDIKINTMLRQKEKHFARKEKVHGQFLTPLEVARFIVQFVTQDGEKGIGVDPACGEGVFLRALAEAGLKKIIGVDIDAEVLVKLPNDVKGDVEILLGDGLHHNSLLEESADIVVGNPPFSAKYGRVTDKLVLCDFHLGKARKSQAIEVLFLERFLQLAAQDGTIGIILPQGIFSTLPLKYIRDFLKAETEILGIVSLPRGIFSNGTTSKTCILFARGGTSTTRTFMGIARCLDDLPLLREAYEKHQQLEDPPAFWVEVSSDTFDPEFYWLSQITRQNFNARLPVKPLSEVLSDIHCGGTEYAARREFVNSGIRFISAKTITPLGIDFSRDERYIEPNGPMDKKWAHVSPGDILFVRVGVGCSGRASAVINTSDIGIADDWIYIIRAKGISPFYLTLFFYTKLGKMQIDSLKHGVGTVNIPQRLLKQILVPIPPHSLQEDIRIGYQEMVELRRAGYTTKAREKFEQMKTAIEAIVSQ